MSRNLSGIYILPAGSIVSTGDTILPTQHNTPLNDIASDLNLPRPVVAGGTGADNAADALVNLGLTATAAEINSALDGITATVAELNLLSGVTTLDGFPAGGIIMWSGSIATIPSGWLLCDGTSGTPDLTGRFVVHADADSGGTYAPGATGGADSVTLSTAQIPSHTHSFSGTTGGAGSHSHTINTVTQIGFGGLVTGVTEETINPGVATSEPTNGVGDHTHSFSGTTGGAGSSNAHENRPPYYALAYIMKA